MLVVEDAAKVGFRAESAGTLLPTHLGSHGDLIEWHEDPCFRDGFVPRGRGLICTEATVP